MTQQIKSLLSILPTWVTCVLQGALKKVKTVFPLNTEETIFSSLLMCLSELRLALFGSNTSHSHLLKLLYNWQQQSCQHTMSLNHCLQAQAQISASQYNLFWVTARLWVFNWCNLMSLTSNEVGWIRTRAFLWGLPRPKTTRKWSSKSGIQIKRDQKSRGEHSCGTASQIGHKLHPNSVLNYIHPSLGNLQCQEHGFVILRSILMFGLRNL